MISEKTQSWLMDFILLTLGIILLYGLFLGSYPLSVPDEARYAEIPREMLANHNFITPYLNGVKYFEKPALFYWLQAGALQLFGLQEWATRLVNVSMALLGCLLTYSGGRLLFDRRSGLLASIILATSALYFGMAHIITLDMTFSVLLSACLLFFLLAVKNPGEKPPRIFCYSAYVMAALAMLTKGLAGIVLPGVVIGAWILLLNEWRLLKNIYLPSGMLIFLTLVLPWHFLVQQQNPEFFHFYFIEQHFLRYLTTYAKRYQPVWFFVPILLAGLLPWTAFLPQAIKYHWPLHWATRQQQRIGLFLLLWAALIFLFFSFSDSKLIPYILPLFPPLALLVGHYLSAGWQGGRQFSFIASGAIIFYLILASQYHRIDMGSIKPLAQIVKPLLKPGSEIACYKKYYQDLPYYLRQQVTVVDWSGELAFGMQHQDTSAWMIDSKKFWRQWQSDKLVFMIIDQKKYQGLQRTTHYSFQVLAKTKKDLLVTNHAL
jgi:4-amino-4-deoxy-L-arabinose transferase-like glycosyltransferase